MKTAFRKTASARQWLPRVALAGIAASPLAAQTVPGKEITELTPYTVVGETTALFTLPGSGYRIEGPELDAFQLDDLNQLLQRVPGAYFRPEDGYGLLANISLRGVDTSRSAKLTLMEDGIPTAPAPYSAPAAYYSPTVGGHERTGKASLHQESPR